MKQKGLIITLISVLFLTLIYFSLKVSVTNTEITLREQTVHQVDVCEANHDKMFKVIAQMAKVPKEFMKQARESFKDIYPELMEGRYGNDGDMLMKWIHESNPQFDLNAFKGLYENLQIAIESNRQEFFVEQKKLIDLHREHKVYIQKFPQRIFLKDKKEVEIVVISSTHTKQVFETGIDDNLELFD